MVTEVKMGRVLLELQTVDNDINNASFFALMQV